MPTPATGGAAITPPTQPAPTLIRRIRVSGNPTSITVYGTFSPQVEAALWDSWLSQYEYTFLEQLLPRPGRGGVVNDPLDLLEVLRQVRLKHGYRPGPGPNQVDDLYNLGYYSSGGSPTIATYVHLPANKSNMNSFVALFHQAQSTGLKPFKGLMTGAEIATVNNVIGSRMADRDATPAYRYRW